MSVVGELLIALGVSTAGMDEGLAKAKGEMAGYEKESSSGFSKLASLGKVAAIGIAGAVVGGGIAAVKMASDFQESQTQLVTGAGESKKNLAMVSQGILNMSGQVGQSAMDLSKGLYLIESAGYHGSKGLQVLKASAEGATTGGAQLATVAGAVTTAMTDYSLPTDKANNVTSALIETVASGKTNLQDLGSALGKVMPTASALGINFQTVTGAMATMTNAGLTARFAATHLQTTLLALSAPSTVATKSMASVGLTAQQVKDSLGTKGLSATLQMIEQHVGSTFPAGSVASVTALKNIMGGVTGYSTALMIGGKHSKEFQDDVKNIGDRLTGSGKSVQGFGLASKDLNFQLRSAKDSLDAFMIEVGEKLLPIVSAGMKDLEGFASWFLKSKTAMIAVGAVIAAVLVPALAAFAIQEAKSFGKRISNMAQDVSKTASWVKSKLSFNSKVVADSQTTADAQCADNAEVSECADGTAADVEASQTAQTGAIEEGAATRETTIGEEVAANESGATRSAGAWIASNLRTLASTIATGAERLGAWLATNAVMVASAVATGVAAAAAFLLPLAPFILIGAAVALLVALVVMHFSQIKAFISGVVSNIVSWFTSLPGDILNGIKKVVGDIEGVWNTVNSDAKKVVDGIVNFFVKLPGRIMQAIGGLAGDIGGLLSKIPGVGAISGLLGHLASGGPAMAGGAYLIGEQGPEILQMGSQSGTVTPNSALGGSGIGGGQLANEITINVTNPAPEPASQSVQTALRRVSLIGQAA